MSHPVAFQSADTLSEAWFIDLHGMFPFLAMLKFAFMSPI